jgi:phosphoenolpyruvate carboxykinase (GTP)
MATALHTLASLAEISKNVADWVLDVQALTQPDRVYWCDGSQLEFQRLRGELSARGELRELNQKTFPGCFLYRSSPNDVARVEQVTYICTRSQDDAGPNNNWMDPTQAHAKMRELFRGSMRGRTLYVVPYIMGPPDSPYSRCGVEITDSPYVVLNMHLMTRMGRAALERIATEDSFVRGMHSVGELDPARRFIMHFPEELAIESFGSGYGGNALLGKKCHALRIAGWQARDEGWLAEHMLIVGLQNPRGETHSVHVDPAGFAAGLEGLHGRGRYRLAASGPRRATLGHQPGGGILRRRTGHQREDQPQRLRDGAARYAVHQRGLDRR